MTFPKDFNKEMHSVVSGAYQWLPKKEQPIFISIVGGGYGLYGDGITTFEMMLGNKVYAHQSKEEINTLLEQLFLLIDY